MIAHCKRLPLLLAVILGGTGWLQTEAVSAQDPEKVTRLVVHPADAPDPALKYRLLPTLIERRPDNAAVWYGKVTAEQTPFFSSREIWDHISDWATLPLEEVRTNESLRNATRDNTVFEILARAARSEYCDWQLPIRDEPFHSILLPEIQQTRSFARLLAVRVRRQVADGDFDGAIRTLQSGYALARNVGQGPTLINALVGFAESNLMSDQLQELVQQPGAPNLYWALTLLPDPLVDLRPGVEAEIDALRLSFPELRNLTSTEYGDDYWRQQLREIWKFTAFFSDVRSKEPAALIAVTVRGYPIAKQGLLEAGWEKERIAAMPVPQVVLLYSVMQYERVRDERMKWLFVPHPLANREAPDDRQNAQENSAEAQEVLPLSDVLLPSVTSIRNSAARSHRRLAVLRLVEALRLYGARHDGQLPPSLDAITEVPLPLDPATGAPFDYHLEGETAVVEGPDFPGLPFRVEIRFAASPAS